MTVSIVIPHDTRRDSTYLSRCLASLSNCNYDVVIASEGNKSEARNKAILECDGEIIVLLDDDVVVRNGSIEELLHPFKDEKVGIVGGVNVNLPNISFREKVSSMLWASPFAMFRSASRYTPRGDIRETDEAEIISCFMAIRRKAFIEAGGFPTNIIPCEENVLINNVQGLGYKIIYNPFAVVYHRRPKIFMEYWKQIYGYGYGRGKMIRQRRGRPKMLYTPSKRLPFYIVALIGHYFSYIMGLVVGFLS